MHNICGIIPCGQLIQFPGAVTCNDPSHIDWHKKWMNCFKWLSYLGVQQVICCQNTDTEELLDVNVNVNAGGNGNHGGNANVPALCVQLPMLQNIPGHNVVHTFHAGITYCIQTIQWACKTPIGWGKCCKSESSPQVLAILDTIWADHPQAKPSFIAYDDACDLLRHIIMQDPNSSWLQTTKFIVDAWHYIGHKATNILC
jgi:hypothetical protein